MSLWKPYADDVALNLSKAAAVVHEPQLRQYPYPRHYAANRPVSKLSPDSTRSWYSVPSAPSSPEPHNKLYDSELLSEDVEYQAFERDAFRAMAEKNGGTLLANNPKMRRAVQTTQTADDSYRKQRERNNLAAKQSREKRKLREARLTFQVTFLKRKVNELRARLAAGVCGRCGQVCRQCQQ